VGIHVNQGNTFRGLCEGEECWLLQGRARVLDKAGGHYRKKGEKQMRKDGTYPPTPTPTAEP